MYFRSHWNCTHLQLLCLTEFFLQNSGTSMGAKMAKRNPHLHNILYWIRYIDDIFFIWTGTDHELQEFFKFINTNYCDLSFTMDFDMNKMNFLDILVYRDSGRLCSNLYRKSTDRNSILHGHSFHPTALKKSLPLSQFNRVRRICTSDSDYQTQANDLVKRFQ